MTTATRTTAHRQAAAQLESVAAMAAALAVDYDRLEELREERAFLADELEEAAECVRHHHDGELDENGREAEHAEYRRCRDELAAWSEENADELAELEEAAGDCESREESENAIHEDALSLEFRSAWQTPGEDLEPAEYRIVLCTGGPHVEMVGEMDADGGPDTVRVLFRDWGESGELFDFDHEAAIAYARCIMGA